MTTITKNESNIVLYGNTVFTGKSLLCVTPFIVFILLIVYILLLHQNISVNEDVNINSLLIIPIFNMYSYRNAKYFSDTFIIKLISYIVSLIFFISILIFYLFALAGWPTQTNLSLSWFINTSTFVIPYTRYYLYCIFVLIIFLLFLFLYIESIFFKIFKINIKKANIRTNRTFLILISISNIVFAFIIIIFLYNSKVKFEQVPHGPGNTIGIYEGKLFNTEGRIIKDYYYIDHPYTPSKQIELIENNAIQRRHEPTISNIYLKYDFENYSQTKPKDGPIWLLSIDNFKSNNLLLLITFWISFNLMFTAFYKKYYLSFLIFLIVTIYLICIYFNLIVFMLNLR